MTDNFNDFITIINTKIKDSKQSGCSELIINRPKFLIKNNKNILTDQEKKFFKELADKQYKILFLPKFKFWDLRSPSGIEIYKIKW